MAFVIDLTREIDAPAELVWEVVSDLPRYGEWNPFCVACESTLRPGDPIDMRVKLVGRPQRQREWMREFTAGTGFGYTMRPVPGGTLSSRRSHTIDALGPARTRYHSYFRLEGWLHPVVAALLGGRLRAGFAGMTDALARRAELLRAERA